MIADELELPPRNLGGRPPHEPTLEQRQQVETLSGYGLTQEQIAAFVHIGVETLVKHYAEEMMLGRVKADAKVAASLFDKATSKEHPQAIQAAIWWEKTRAGRKEPKQEFDANVNSKVEHTADEAFRDLILAMDGLGRAKAANLGGAGAVDHDGEASATST